MQFDYAIQRKNMVESQVRPSDITDRRISRAMLDVPRELFVPADRRAIAYMDENLPLGPSGQRPERWLMAPRTLAKLVQLLDLGERDVVLDIGCGSGYAAAILSRIAQTVVAVESSEAMATEAGRALAEAGIDNVAVVRGDLDKGFPSEGPYDAILLSGAVSEIPATIFDQLKDGGRLAGVVVEGGIGRATRWRRIGGKFDSRPAFEVGFQMLAGFERKPEFVF
jgi:protein-L-isoaspartate(D-aspartate) O-methyltransferase